MLRVLIKHSEMRRKFYLTFQSHRFAAIVDSDSTFVD
jgi:hypothetical protein